MTTKSNKAHTGCELNNNGWCRKNPISNHNMTRNKINIRNIFAAIGYKHKKCTANTCAKQDG